MKTFALGLAALMMGFGGAAGAATLDGDHVNCRTLPFFGAIRCDENEGFVGVGAEFTLQLATNDIFSVDIAESSVRLEYIAAPSLTIGSSTSLILAGLDFTPHSVISGITNFQTSAGSGVELSDISFGFGSITFDMTNTFWIRAGEFMSFDFETKELPPDVPLPASGLLILAGLGAMGWMRRKS